jgi:uncharacterized protein YkwD
MPDLVPHAHRAGAFLALALSLLLAACDRPGEAPPAMPAPDTTAMGAGPAVGSCGIRQLRADILQRINEARAGGGRWGAPAMAPAVPLKWDASLFAAAAGHSLDMAKRNYFEHQSPEGRSVSDRAAANRYPWKFVGENIAAGNRGVDDVMQGWLASPDHCRNIMDPGFHEVAVACVQQPGSQWGTYWTMVLGRK